MTNSTNNERALRAVTVRPVRDGFAVFGRGGQQMSSVFAERDAAVAEAESYVGERGLVLIENATGHVVSEHI